MAIKKVEKDASDNGSIEPVGAGGQSDRKQQEYLNARRRTKTAVKVAIGIVIALVVVVVGGCVATSIGSNAVAEGKAKISESSSSLQGKYYEDVKTLLTKDGFTNIELRPEGDLITGVLHDDGDVDTVSIDGKTSFSSGQQFDTDAKIVISYHSYPDKSGTDTANSNASNTNANANASKNTSASTNTSSSASATTDSAAFRKSVDDYETFIDSYVEFMNKYNSDSSNVASMAADYAKMLTQYEQLSKEMDAVDTGKLSSDDLAYYTAALTRCNEKLATIKA